MNTDKNTLKRVRWGKDLEKYFLPAEGFSNTPVPIKSVFVLETTNTDKMEISILKGAGKIDPLLDNTYRRRFLEGLGGKQDHFRQCAAVAAHTNVYKVVRPDRGFLLYELMEMVEARFLS
jgi:hypothetical protein